MDSLFGLFDQFLRINLTYYPQNQQAYISESWEQFLSLLQSQPLDYGKIYTLINRMTYEDITSGKNERQSSSQRQVARNITAASSPRIVSSSSVSKNSTNILSKIQQMDNVASPKIAVSNLASQQSLINKNSIQQNVKQQQMVDDFNRHLLLSKIKELQFNYSVSTDKLYAIAKIFQSKESQPISKSPIKYPLTQFVNKSRGSNHSAEHYKIVA
ncbi:unnamed protein product [Paramecium sonneborni]|uniref:Uncharacterized protein n=1 Tax=Paramecium sonneborni TaxID=65129 RepID=A0A8S1MBM0_9CILI|nr:unnamed protein product [Paramecium sonneborni]